MKPVLILIAACFLTTLVSAQQDKAARPSPPAAVQMTLPGGKTVSIDYSQPSVKGRTIGKDLEPINGKVWRTGANEATVFEVNKDVRIEGKKLRAGKYGLFTIAGDDEWTIIFNKTWKQWGAFNYKEADDALRVKVRPVKSSSFSERMTFTISNKGEVSLLWGERQVYFRVE